MSMDKSRNASSREVTCNQSTPPGQLQLRRRLGENATYSFTRQAARLVCQDTLEQLVEPRLCGLVGPGGGVPVCAARRLGGVDLAELLGHLVDEEVKELVSVLVKGGPKEDVVLFELVDEGGWGDRAGAVGLSADGPEQVSERGQERRIGRGQELGRMGGRANSGEG